MQMLKMTQQKHESLIVDWDLVERLIMGDSIAISDINCSIRQDGAK